MASKDFGVILVKSGGKDFFCRILLHRLQLELEEESSSYGSGTTHYYCPFDITAQTAQLFKSCSRIFSLTEDI